MFISINGDKSHQVAMAEAIILGYIKQNKTKNKVGKASKLVEVNIEEYKNKMTLFS